MGEQRDDGAVLYASEWSRDGAGWTVTTTVWGGFARVTVLTDGPDEQCGCGGVWVTLGSADASRLSAAIERGAEAARAHNRMRREMVVRNPDLA